MSVARMGLELAVKVPRFDRSVAGAEPDVSLEAVDGDAAVARMDIDGPFQCVRLHRAIPRLDLEIG